MFSLKYQFKIRILASFKKSFLPYFKLIFSTKYNNKVYYTKLLIFSHPMNSSKLTDFTEFVTKHTCVNTKYFNLDLMVQDVIDIVDNYVEDEIDDEDREYIKDSHTTYDVLDEKDLNDNVMKIISGLNDTMFDLVNEEGVLTIDNYDLDIQSDLSKLVYKHYFDN